MSVDQGFSKERKGSFRWTVAALNQKIEGKKEGETPHLIRRESRTSFPSLQGGNQWHA